jgi:hypothetical protein
MGKSARAEAGRITCPPAVGGGATAGGTGTDDNPTNARGGIKPERDWGRVPMVELGTSRRADTGRMGGADPDGRVGIALEAMLRTVKHTFQHNIMQTPSRHTCKVQFGCQAGTNPTDG